MRDTVFHFHSQPDAPDIRLEAHFLDGIKYDESQCKQLAALFAEVLARCGASDMAADLHDMHKIAFLEQELEQANKRAEQLQAEVLSLKQKLSGTRLSFIILSIACSIVLFIETFIIR